MSGLLTNLVRRFRKSEDGAAVVEFVLCLPVMILFFGLLVEFGRLYWGYQSTLIGVRDATRYLARVAPVDICLTGGSLGHHEAALKSMIENDRAGTSVMPRQVTVNSVTATYACVSGTYRTSPAPVATVAAQVTVQFPLGFALDIFSASISSVTTTVADSSRIYGQ
jgi:Flp pilus assembly protein TadG